MFHNISAWDMENAKYSVISLQDIIMDHKHILLKNVIMSLQ
jgi:hypothetical protein